MDKIAVNSLYNAMKVTESYTLLKFKLRRRRRHSRPRINVKRSAISIIRKTVNEQS